MPMRPAFVEQSASEASTDDGREGTAIYEVTGARHHHVFPNTVVEGALLG